MSQSYLLEKDNTVNSCFCSTIIPTVNRTTLSRAVESVLAQGFDRAEYEVIVVNDSGRPLPAADWQSSDRVRLITTNRWERSVARNTGAAIARGEHLHFLDDDDVILPGMFEAFWKTTQRSDAIWFFGGWQTVDDDGHPIAEFFPELRGNIFPLLVSGEGLPLQASLIRSESFFAAGAFDPTMVGAEDHDLGMRLMLLGDIEYIPHMVARIRIGERGSTTDWSQLAEQDRFGREKALSAYLAFQRLRSAQLSSYWHGRVSRAYFASSVWNMKSRQILTAIGRVIFGLYFSGLHLFRRSYWQGLRKKIS